MLPCGLCLCIYHLPACIALDLLYAAQSSFCCPLLSLMGICVLLWLQPHPPSLPGQLQEQLLLLTAFPAICRVQCLLPSTTRPNPHRVQLLSVCLLGRHTLAWPAFLSLLWPCTSSMLVCFSPTFFLVANDPSEQKAGGFLRLHPPCDTLQQPVPPCSLTKPCMLLNWGSGLGFCLCCASQ